MTTRIACDDCDVTCADQSSYMDHLVHAHTMDCGVTMRRPADQQMLTPTEQFVSVDFSICTADNAVHTPIELPQMRVKTEVFMQYVKTEPIPMSTSSSDPSYSPASSPTDRAMAKARRPKSGAPTRMGGVRKARHAVRCPECGKDISCESSLRRHRRLIHGIDILELGDDNTRAQPIREPDAYDAAYYSTRKHRCEQCPKAYTSTANLRLHQNGDHRMPLVDRSDPFDESYYESRAHRCHLCPHAYVESAYLRRHLQQVHGEVLPYDNKMVYSEEYYRTRPHRCQHEGCPKSYITADNLRSHVFNQHRADDTVYDTEYYSTRPFKCEDCKKAYVQHDALRNHARSFHNRALAVLILANGLATCEANKYDEDYYTERPERCTHCSKAYKTKPRLRDHMKIIHSIHLPFKVFDRDYYSNRSNNCGYCPKAYANRTMLRRHMSEEHDVLLPYANATTFDAAYYAARAYKCEKDACPKAFKTLESLRSHTNGTHREETGIIVFDAAYYAERPFKCDQCRLAYRQYMPLRAHVRSAHAMQMPAKPSSAMPKVEASESKYDSDYYAKRPSRCALCVKAYNTRSQLRGHMKTIHDEDMGYDMPKRGPTFDDRYYSTREERCPECPRAFQHRSGLKFHMKKFHNSIELALNMGAEYYRLRPARCPHCPSAFRDDVRLKNHLKYVHKLALGAPLKCDKKSFVKRGPRRSGVKKETNVEIEQPTEPSFDFQCLYGNCEFEFTSEEDRLSHFRFTHWLGQRYPTCPHCSEVFSEGFDLMSHVHDCCLGKEKTEEKGEMVMENNHSTFKYDYCDNVIVEVVDVVNVREEEVYEMGYNLSGY